MTGVRCLLAVAVAALASPGQIESPIIRVTVNLVQVDAVVTDSKGRQVTDLKAEDFEITEDGRPQKITNFSYIRLAPPAPPPAAPLPPGTVAPPPAPAVAKRGDVRRTIVLVVDDLGLSFESMGEVRHDLKHFVEQQLQPGDLAAIVRTSGGMGALDQFTTDRRLLLAAVERLRWYPGGRSGLSAMEPVNPGPGSGLEARSQDAQFRRVTYSLGTLGAVSYLLNGMRDMLDASPSSSFPMACGCAQSSGPGKQWLLAMPGLRCGSRTCGSRKRCAAWRTRPIAPPWCSTASMPGAFSP